MSEKQRGQHMTRVLAFLILIVATNLGIAQNLLITNARIVDGNGGIIDRGAIVVRDGRIVSVSTDAPVAPESMSLDARGMTVMPGFIDSHVHVTAYEEGATTDAALAEYIEDELPALLREMLEAGVTTALDTGAHFPAIVGVSEQLEDGRLVGPRLLTAGSVFTHPEGHPATTICQGNPFCREVLVNMADDPAVARARVAELAEGGVDIIKAVHQAGAHLPIMDESVVAALATEAEVQGIPFYVHGTYFSGMVRAVGLGVDGFVHIPWRDQVDREVAREEFAAAGIPVSTTVSLHDSLIDDQGTRKTVVLTTFPPAQESDRAQAVANAKAFRDAGVTLAFGTDQQPLRPYGQAVLGEARALAEVLSAEQVIAVLTRNAAKFLNLSDEIGTLEAGKLADLVIVEGDPLADISDIANVAVVIQRGRIVVDAR